MMKFNMSKGVFEKVKFDFDKELEACKAKKKPYEIIVYAVESGRVMPKLGYIKQQRKAIEYIKDLEGFIGIHPVTTWNTLILFDSLNHAKQGKNLMKSKGIKTGKHIVPVLIPWNSMYQI